jgi:predicted HTH transcriptional regulator
MYCRQNPKIAEFILRNVSENPKTITMLTAKHFGYSRTGIARYLSRLIAGGIVLAQGTTKARSYSLSVNVAIDIGPNSVTRLMVTKAPFFK